MTDYAYEDTDYDTDDEDYEDDDDSVTLNRLAELEAENARLRAQVGGPPPKPVQDLTAALHAAQSPEEVNQVIAAHNAGILASMPAPPAPEIDHEALTANIRAANSPDEVMMLLHTSGMPTSMNPGGDY